MSCYKVNIDGIAYDIYAKDLRRTLDSVALVFGCHYIALGSQYYEDDELRDYRYNDLMYYDYVVSKMKR